MKCSSRVPLILAAIVLGCLLAGCIPQAAGPAREEPRAESTEITGPVRLADVEVQQYEGKRLGSVDDFRENSIAGPQDVDRATYRLKVDGEVERPLSLTYAQVIAYPRYEKLVRLNCVEGWSVDVLWEGVRLADLLEDAGARSGSPTVIFHCYDGYTTSLPLDFIVGEDILLAFKMNGIEMPTERGFPFQVVAQDRLGYKWAKWVTRIEVSDDPDYQGYWEQRGYDNSATVSEE